MRDRHRGRISATDLPPRQRPMGRHREHHCVDLLRCTARPLPTEPGRPPQLSREITPTRPSVAPSGSDRFPVYRVCPIVRPSVRPLGRTGGRTEVRQKSIRPSTGIHPAVRPDPSRTCSHPSVHDVRPFGRYSIRSVVRSVVRSFVRSFVRLFVRLFVRSFVRSFDRHPILLSVCLTV